MADGVIGMARADLESLAENMAVLLAEEWECKSAMTYVEMAVDIAAVIVKAVERAGAAKPTRLQAAERAVVETAVAYRAAWTEDDGDTYGTSAAMADAINRLRDVRKAAAAEECEAVDRPLRELRETLSDRAFNAAYPEKSQARGYALMLDTFPGEPVRCTKPRGHEGEHEGDLGRFRWP